MLQSLYNVWSYLYFQFSMKRLREMMIQAKRARTFRAGRKPDFLHKLSMHITVKSYSFLSYDAFHFSGIITYITDCKYVVFIFLFT